MDDASDDTKKNEYDQAVRLFKTSKKTKPLEILKMNGIKYYHFFCNLLQFVNGLLV